MSIFAQASVTSGIGLIELPPLIRRISKLIDAAARALLAGNSHSALTQLTREEAMIAAARSAFGCVEATADEAEL